MLPNVSFSGAASGMERGVRCKLMLAASLRQLQRGYRLFAMSTAARPDAASAESTSTE